MTFYNILKQFRAEHRWRAYVGHRGDVYFRNDADPTKKTRVQIDSSGNMSITPDGYVSFVPSASTAAALRLYVTTDNPTVNILAESGSGGYVFSASAAGWIEILVGGNARYIPCWA